MLNECIYYVHRVIYTIHYNKSKDKSNQTTDHNYLLCVILENITYNTNINFIKKNIKVLLDVLIAVYLYFYFEDNNIQHIKTRWIIEFRHKQAKEKSYFKQ